MKAIQSNKKIPELIKKEVNFVLEHYPRLKNTSIEFIIKPSLATSFMKAQPTLRSIFVPKSKRKYRILMSNSFKVDNYTMTLKEIPENVLIGWISHELGHVLDYENRNGFELAVFGFRYLFSQSHLREAERVADSYAVSNNMGRYILETKNFILNQANFSQKYKERIKRLYVSPNDILVLVKEHENNS